MGKTETTRNKIRSLTESIKKINDNSKSFFTNAYDEYNDDLSSTNGIIRKNITGITSKLKSKNQNKKDIFGEIIMTAEGFLGNEKENSVNSKKKPLVLSKIKNYAIDSAFISLQSSKQIIIDEVKSALFGGDGICGGNNLMTGATLNISPKEIDFINALKVNPDSMSGKIIYEDTSINTGFIKYNKILYERFDDPSTYNFKTNDNRTLFNVTWNSATQNYNLTGIDTNARIGDFLNDYYSSIEYPDITNTLKTAMLMTLQGDGSEPSAFKLGMNNLDRLSQKLLSICGNPSTNSPLKNNTSEQFNEDELDIESYFDFDDVEGIDLDDEDSRNRRVLKFRDCDNFEISVNINHMEDFVYLINKKNIGENITNTLNKTANDVYEQNGGNIDFDKYLSSLFNMFILKIPKALILCLLSPKIFFPIVLIYKMFKGSGLTVLDFMKKLSKLFFNIIKSVFWKFIQVFWKFVKKDLLIFIKNVAAQILINKIKRIKNIISALLNILRRAIESNIESCEEIFGVILSLINKSINAPVKVPIPGLLLVLSEGLPGFSSDRAYLNITERLQSMGVNMGTIYGTENKLNTIIKGIVDGHTEEMDTNSYVKIGLKPTIIPAGVLGAEISPLVEGVGKVF